MKNKFFSLAFLVLVFSFISPFTIVIAQEAGLTTPPISSDQTTQTDQSKTEEGSSTTGEVLGETTEAPTTDDEIIPPKEEPLVEEAISEEAKKEAAEEEIALKSLNMQESSGTNSSKTRLIPGIDNLTGALTYEYQINVPPGRNNMTPDLSLKYNSATATKDSIIGAGWSLNIPSIERINRKGSDKLYSKDYYVSSFSGELTALDFTNYVARTETGDFLTYQKTANGWLAIDKTGTRYTFGANTQARQDDPADSSKVFKWMLEEVRDTNDNFISYEYYKDAGQIYPSKITYTGNGNTPGIFEVNFERENRVNAPVFNDVGFSVKSNYRISEIRTEINNVWAKKYILTYTTGDNTSGSLLNTIIESGQNEVGVITTLPAMELDYQITNHNWSLASTWLMPSYIDDNGNTRGVVLTSTSRILTDVNGDGLPDFVVTSDNQITGNPINDRYNRVYLNTGEKSDYLSKIKLSAGGEISVSYKEEPIIDRNPYRDTQTFYVVDTIEINDGFGNLSTSSVEYENGKFFFHDEQYKTFAGFNSIIKTDPVGNITKTYFHQGDSSDSANGEYNDDFSKIGKAYRQEEYDSAGNLYRLTVNKWDKTNLGTNYDFVKLIRQTILNYDGDSDHVDIASEYNYDNYGNITQEINWGKVNANNDGLFADTGTDKSTENVLYALNLTNYIVGLPSQDTLIDQNSNKVREKKIYYDTLSFGLVGNGNMTKEENWVSSTTYINNQKTYNTTYGTIISETDPRGKITSYTYDSYNLYPITITNPLNQITQYLYDYSAGKPKQITDQNNFIYQTVYDGLDRVKEEKVPNSISPYAPVLKTAYNYTDTSGAVKIQRSNYLNGSNIASNYQYFNGLNRLIQERKEAETINSFNVRDIVYNNLGLVLKESLPYSGTGSAKTSATTTASLYTNYTYDALQRPLITTNALGSTNYAYDDLKTTITDANGKMKNYYKDARDNLITVDEINGSSTYTTNYEWNLNKKLTKITDALGNVRNFTYDGLGRKLTAEDLHALTDSTFGSWTYAYDNASNLTQTINPRNQTVNYTYDDLNRILTEDYITDAGTEISYSYDNCANGIGKLCSTTMTSGANTSFTYNSNGKIASETKNINSTNYLTSYTYDRQGNILTITYPDNAEAKYTFNSAGLLEKTERKENGGAYVNIISNFDYNPLDQITVQAYPNGIITTNTYDATKMYRLTRKRTLFGLGSGTTTVNFYPSAGDGYVYYDNSNWDITHDAISGTLANYTSTAFYTGAGKSSSTNYRIYKAFLPFDTSSLPDGIAITSAKLKVYVSSKLNNDNDGDDWLTVVQATQPSTTTLTTADYDLAGNINNPTEGIDLAERKDITNITTNAYLTFNLNTTGKSWINTTGPTKLGLREGHDVIDSPFAGTLASQYNYVYARTSNYTGTNYDPVLEITYNNGGNTLQDLNYLYDNVNNITRITDSSNTNSAKTIDYVYDDLYRLTSAVATNTANNQNYTQNFSYDALGNILTGPVGNYLYQGNTGTLKANPHTATSINGATYTYDNDGNLTSNGALTNTWNYKNQLTQSVASPNTITYLYDHEGNRVKYAKGTTITYYPNKFYNTDGTKKTKQIYSGDQLVATIETVGTVVSPYYIHTDNLGSTNIVSNSSGVNVELLDYYPYGNQRISSGTYNEQRKFIGQINDIDTGLDYLNARYYKSNIGKFISQDPEFWTTSEKWLLDPQNQNSYAYARNNPINLSDPTGKSFLGDLFKVQIAYAPGMHESFTQPVTDLNYKINFAPGVNQSAMSSFSKYSLQDSMIQSNEKSVLVTRTTSTPEEQAKIMYNNTIQTGVAAQLNLYGSYGDQVINMYPSLSGMINKIKEIDSTKVSAHLQDPSVRNVFDVAPSSITNDNAFISAIQNNSNVDTKRFLTPFTQPKDTSYHIEIPQSKK